MGNSDNSKIGTLFLTFSMPVYHLYKIMINIIKTDTTLLGILAAIGLNFVNYRLDTIAKYFRIFLMVCYSFSLSCLACSSNHLVCCAEKET